MPLEILLPIVILGISGIVILTHILGYSRRFTITDETTAIREWHHHWPEDRVLHLRIADDGLSALVITTRGAGLLRSFGADTVAHRIKAATLTHDGLRLDFGDFGTPPTRISLPTDDLPLWQSDIERFTA